MTIFCLIILLVFYVYLGIKKPGIALLTSPFVTGTILVIGLASEDFVMTGTAAIIFFSTLIAIMAIKIRHEEIIWPKRLAEMMLFVIALSLIFLAIVLFSYIAIEEEEFWPLLFIPGLILVAATIIGFRISFRFSSLHTVAAYIMSTIGSSVRQNLPLPMALESAASGRSDERAKILQNIKKWLVQGYSLSESIKRGYPKCPGYAVAMIAAAERINQVPLALKAVEANIAAQTEENRKIRPVHPIYPVIVISFMLFMLLGVMLFIIPQFVTTLKEITGGATLPAITRIIVGMGAFLTRDYGLITAFIFTLVVFISFLLWVYIKFRPRRPDEPYLLSKIGDFIKWHLPVLHWFERNYSMVQVVEMLRLSLNAGCPLNNAIDNTIGLDVNHCFKRRLRKWHQKVECGDRTAAAAKTSKLGSVLAWAFDEQVNQGNTLAILETLESFYRSNYNYCVNLARFIIWPCIILCLGLLVGFVVLAIFAPSIAIITHLAGAVTP